MQVIKKPHFTIHNIYMHVFSFSQIMCTLLMNRKFPEFLTMLDIETLPGDAQKLLKDLIGNFEKRYQSTLYIMITD